MFFTAYAGAKPGVAAWRGAVLQHAADLGLTPTIVSHPLASAPAVWCAWLSRKDVVLHDHVRMTHTGCLAAPLAPLTMEEREAPGTSLRARLAGHWRSGDIRVCIDTHDGSVMAALPPASPQQIYWTRQAHGLVVADDLRFCARFSSGTVDSSAALALLQFGTVPPPLTIFRDVRRMPNGHAVVVDARGQATLTARVPPWSEAAAGDDAEGWLMERLDAQLARVPKPALLFFSGGVDSGLLASRLARLGRTDAALAAYSFSPADPESRLAGAMARHLGFSCLTVAHDPRSLAGVLARVGTDYSFPFGDLSTVAMNALVHEIRDCVPAGTTIVEGTGADGEFGLAARYPVWARAYATPPVVRRGVRSVFRALALWRRNSDVARLAGFLSRAAGLPLELTALAQNPLEGIAYHTPPDIAGELVECMLGQFQPLAPAHRPETAVSLMDVVLICAGTMAPKSFDPLRRHGLRPLYPFLDPSIAYGSLSLPTSVTCANGEAKSMLKSALAQAVPPAWVYRPKSGFTPPYVAVCASPPFQAMLRDVALGSHSPLLDYCDARVVRHMADCASRGEPLTPGVHDFLWALTFGAAWLAAARRTEPRAQAC